MASQDMQRHIGDMSITNDRCIGAMSTEWTYTNQPLVPPHILGPGKNRSLDSYDLSGAECSVQYIAKRLSCRILNIWLPYSVVKLRVL